MTREELDWKQYEMMASTIRWATELLLKVNIFYYTVAGAVLSFYLSRPAPQPRALKYILVMPALLAFIVAFIFIRAALTTRHVEAQIQSVVANLQLTAWPDTSALKPGLIGSSVLLLIVAVALVAVIFFEERLGLRA